MGGQYLHSSRKFCISNIPNCLIYSYDGCAQCQQQYVTITSNKSQCIVSPSINYQLQNTANPASPVVLCLENNFYFDSNTSSCMVSMAVSATSIQYCLQGNTTGVCSQCILGYFLSTDQKFCVSCSSSINNCLTCTFNCTNPIVSACKPNCTICEPTHFPFFYQGQSICRPCTTYGCKTCQLNSNQSIVCTDCERGQTLYNNTCYSCP